MKLLNRLKTLLAAVKTAALEASKESPKETPKPTNKIVGGTDTGWSVISGGEKSGFGNSDLGPFGGL